MLPDEIEDINRLWIRSSSGLGPLLGVTVPRSRAMR
jgi:hypothetical protein